MEPTAGQYITFRIAQQHFALDASRVRGILPADQLLSHFGENLSEYISGFAVLAGRAFPVIDLVAKLGLQGRRTGRQPYIVAVEIQTGEGPQLAGFIADRISEVIPARVRDFHLGKLRSVGRPRLVFDPEILLGAEVSL